MNSSNENDSLQNLSAVDDVEAVSTEVGSGMKRMLESLELAAIQRTSSAVNLSDFSTEQKDKLLDIMGQNEKNAFDFNMKRLSVSESINTKALDASIVNQQTLRIVLVISILAFVLLFVLILIFKDEYLQTFLSFTIGLIGGVGIKSSFSSLNKSSKIKVKEEEEDS